MIKIKDCIEKLLDFKDVYLDELSQKDWNEFFVGITKQKIITQCVPRINCSSIKAKTMLQATYKEKYIEMQTLKTTALKICKYFNQAGITYVMVKGFALSQYLYESPFRRDFSDIDFIIHENDIIAACKILENIGGHEKLVTYIEKEIDLSNFLKEYLYFCNKEKKFIIDGCLIEIKKSSPYYENKNFEAFYKRNWIFLDGVSIPILNPEQMFFYSMLNFYANFFDYWGIVTDYTLRDIIDYYKMILKSRDFLTSKSFKTTIKKREWEDIWIKTIQLIVSIYNRKDWAWLNMPVNNQKNVDNHDEILDRIWDQEKRIYEYKQKMHNYCIKNSQLVFSHKLIYPPFDIMKAKLDVSCYIPTDNYLVNVLPYPLYLGAHYSKDYIYLSIKSHKNYFNLGIDFFCIPYEYQPYTKTTVELKNGEVHKFDAPWQGSKYYISADCDFRILTVRFSKTEKWKHAVNSAEEYHFYIDIRFISSMGEFPLMIAKYGGLDTKSWFAKVVIPFLP